MPSRRAFRINLVALCLLLSALAAAPPALAPDNQVYLDGLAARMAAFKPTDVLVECRPADQAKYDESFRAYVAGTSSRWRGRATPPS